MDKDEYLTCEEILHSDQKREIEQAKFKYSSLEKAFEKQTKTIENQGKKQIKALEMHGKQLGESSDLVKQDFNIHRDSISLEEQKSIK